MLGALRSRPLVLEDISTLRNLIQELPDRYRFINL